MRLNRTEREAQLLEVFLELAAKEGGDSITLQQLADKAKVSFATVQSYFEGGTRTVVEKAVAFVGNQARLYISQVLEESLQDPQRDPVQAYIRGTFKWAQTKRTHSQFWLYYYYLCASGPRYQTQNRVALGVARSRLRALILEGVGLKKYTLVEEVDAVVLKIHASLVGAVTVALAEGTKTSLQVQCETVLQTAKTLLTIDLKRPTRAI